MKNDNDFTVSLTQALQDMKMEQGDCFDLAKVNLSELERRTGISRAKLRRLKSNNFKEKPHALMGRKALKTVMTGYESVANNLLRQGVKNTSVIYDRLKEVGYKGSLSGIKRYVAANKNLLPPKRYAVEPQGGPLPAPAVRFYRLWRRLLADLPPAGLPLWIIPRFSRWRPPARSAARRLWV